MGEREILQIASIVLMLTAVGFIYAWARANNRANDEKRKSRMAADKINKYINLQADLDRLQLLIDSGWEIAETDAAGIGGWILHSPDEKPRRRYTLETAYERQTEMEKLRRLNIPGAMIKLREDETVKDFQDRSRSDIALRLAQRHHEVKSRKPDIHDQMEYARLASNMDDIDALAGVEINEPESNDVQFAAHRPHIWKEDA